MKHLILTLTVLLFLVTSAFAKVNINTASADELASLPGIGPAKAEAIIKDRKANGTYQKLDDLTRVKGIGEKLVKKLKNEATVNDK